MNTAVHTDAPFPSHRLHLLEGLRGYMAWWVVLFHYLSETGFSSNWLPGVGKAVALGGYAVDVFIILSGFVITHLLVTRKTSYAEFIGRRFFRIYPLFLICMVVGLLLFLPIGAVFETFVAKAHLAGPDLVRWQAYREHLSAYFLICVTMLHGAVPNAWLPYAQAPFDPPAWSISLEWQFYLIFPLVLWGMRKRPGLTLLVVTTVVGFRHLYHVGDWGSFLPQKAEFFVVGILSYRLFRALTRLQIQSQTSIPWTLSVTVLLLLLVAPLRELVTRPYEVAIGDWLPLSIWTFVLALLVETESPAPSGFARGASRIFLHPIAQFLGKVSYSTYLLHYFVIYAVMALCLVFNLTTNKYFSLAAMMLVAAPVTVVISALSYRYIEKPGIELGRRMMKVRKLGAASEVELDSSTVAGGRY